jgi:hypothetical protein
MGVHIIDGTIESLELKRSVMNLRIFREIRFRLRDGGQRTVVKAVTDKDVAIQLQPGASGRFYMFEALDQRGVHGVRDDKGHAVCKFPKNNEIAMGVVVLFSLLWVSATLYSIQDAPIWGTLILLLGTPYYFYLRSLRGQARRQFEADSGYVAAPAAAAPVAAEPAVGA